MYSTLNKMDNWVFYKFGRRMEIHVLDKIQEFAQEKEQFNIRDYLTSTGIADRLDIGITTCENCPKFYLYSMASYAYGEDGNKPDGWTECCDQDCYKEYCDECITKISRKNRCELIGHFYCDEHTSKLDYCSVCKYPITCEECDDCDERDDYGIKCDGCNNKFCQDFHINEVGYPTHWSDGNRTSWTKEKWDKLKKEVLPSSKGSNTWNNKDWQKWYGAFQGTTLESKSYWCTTCDQNGINKTYGQCCKHLLIECDKCGDKNCNDCLTKRKDGYYCNFCDKEYPSCTKCDNGVQLSGWSHECGGKCEECKHFFCKEHIQFEPSGENEYCLDCYQELKQ